MKQIHLLLVLITFAISLATCGNSQKASTSTPVVAERPVGPEFSADSAFSFCQRQCDFGPRTMNSDAHEQCGAWIVEKFQQYGMSIIEQRTSLKGYDGTALLSNNIIASHHPERAERVMLCAHWDSRPWADNDPDEANHTKPVLAANDGASGVAVMLEVARLISQADTLKVGVDFICFDAEDWGQDGVADSWALGAQYWAAHPHRDGYKARYGILLDMVGGLGARFYQEGYSLYHASNIVQRVWQAAAIAGYGSHFPQQQGGGVTDDHIPVNDVAHIPCIDIIPYYPDCDESSFGPTWHTVNDDMQHIDPATLKAVGQTIIQVLYSEQ